MKTRLLCWLLALATPLTGLAQAFPTKPLTLIVTYPAGGFADAAARALAREFSATLGQTVIVSNVAGANGVLGMNTLARAPADGHTLAYSTMSPLALLPHLVKDSPLRPGVLQPLCGVVENTMAIAVKASLPWRSVSDLVAVGRSASLSYGTSGANSAPSLGMEELARQRGAHFVHVPYKGDAPALQDVAAGHLQAAAVLVASAAPLVASGDIRLLAMMSDKRHPGFADVPTLAEGGHAGAQRGYAGLFVPNGLPTATLQALEKACSQAVASDNLRSVARTAQAQVAYLSTADWDRMIRAEHARLGAFIKSAGILPTD